MVQPQNLTRLQKAASAMETVFKELNYGEMTVKDFKFLQKEQQAVLDLCQITAKISREAFKQAMDEREDELQNYRRFVADTNKLWCTFRFLVDIQSEFNYLTFF